MSSFAAPSPVFSPSRTPLPVRGVPVDRPVTVHLRLPAVVGAGVRTLLQPYRRRVLVVADDTGQASDVELFDPQVPRRGPVGRGAPPAARVALIHDPSDEQRSLAMRQGAAAVLPLDVGMAELVSTLDRVRREGRAASRPHANDDDLSERERDVIALVCQGLSNQDIADQLFLSLNTVKTYIRTAYRKMGVTTRSQALLWAIGRGY